MKRLGIISLALAMLLTTACSDSAEPQAPAKTTAKATTTTTAVPTTTTTTAPLPEEPEDWQINFLTGIPNITEESARPVAVMVPNDSMAKGIQYGIDSADLLMECETEGGITRLMAVWADDTRLPKTIGPVRSARSPFVKMATALDAVYIHCGGSGGGLRTLSNTGLAHINAQAYDAGLGNESSGVFWRDRGMYNATNWEHSLITSGNNLRGCLKSQRIRATGANHTPYAVGKVTEGTSGKEAQITFSSAQTVAFKYDAKQNVYKKYNGTLSGGSAHNTAGGKQLTAANVIVMYANRFVEEVSDKGVTVYDFELSSGRGKVLSGGKVRDISWSRSDSGLSFTDTAGNPLTVNEGNTYLCLVNSAQSGNTIIR